MNSLKIGQRLGLVFGIVLALMAGLATVASLQMSKLAGNATYYAKNLVPSYQIQQEIALNVSDYRRFGFMHILVNTEQAMADLESQMKASRDKTQAAFDRYAKTLASDADDLKKLEATKA